MANLIHSIPRDRLDVTAYDRCINQSLARKIYAYSWYLDAMCDNWYALVMGDYEAVMPVPFRRKWGISYVYQPLMVQQLGVFSREPVETDAYFKKLFYRHIHVDYTFHSPNTLKTAKEKTNLILPIQAPMDDLISQFSKNRRRDLKKAKNEHLILSEFDTWATISKLISEKLTDGNLPSLDRINKLINASKTYGSIGVVSVSQEENIIYCLLYGLDGDRLYYLLPIELDPVSKTVGTASMAITELIRTHKESVEVFDFEGSSIPGVRRFYESFNGIPEPYYHVRKTATHFLKHAR